MCRRGGSKEAGDRKGWKHAERRADGDEEEGRRRLEQQTRQHRELQPSRMTEQTTTTRWQRHSRQALSAYVTVTPSPRHVRARGAEVGRETSTRREATHAPRNFMGLPQAARAAAAQRAAAARAAGHNAAISTQQPRKRDETRYRRRGPQPPKGRPRHAPRGTTRLSARVCVGAGQLVSSLRAPRAPHTHTPDAALRW